MPYGRGRLGPSSAEVGKPFEQRWLGTLFAASLMAAAGQPAWSRVAAGELGWCTQRRQIQRAGEWLGLAAPQCQAEQAALELGEELAAHRRACQEYAQPGFRRRSRAVESLLKRLDSRSNPLRRLLRAGKVAGACGSAWHCGEEGQLVPVFPALERVGP